MDSSDNHIYQNDAYDGDIHEIGNTSKPNMVTVAIPDDSSETSAHGNCCTRAVQKTQNSMDSFCHDSGSYIWYSLLALVAVLYGVYFGWAMYFRFGDEGSIRLLWVTAVVVVCLMVAVVKSICCPSGIDCPDRISQHSSVISWAVALVVYLGILTFILVDVLYLSKTPYNLVSGAGILVYILLLYIFSKSPAHVQWRAVVWGMGLQFIFALIILRWEGGYQAFVWLGDRVAEFLSHSDAGAKFVFGDEYLHHFFAFKVLPVVVFFSCIISILYYWGVMQFVIRKLAWVMQAVMGTTAAESLNAAANIFIGMSEAPLMIRPMIPHMTRSEIHAVMTGGFATIAGTVLAAYILFGVPANHLLSASVMSAPAALAMAKLFYPETEKSKTTAKDVAKMGKSEDRNVLDAASSGAIASVKLVAYIAANLIAFVAVLSFINATLVWFGLRVGLDPAHGKPELTFELICSYLFFPLALVMGIDLKDCRRVAELVGIKTFLNEFVAFGRLGKIIQNRRNFTACMAINGTTFDYKLDDLYVFLPNSSVYVLPKGVLTERSEVISTYALCGFANIGSIGILIGVLSALSPERKADISSVALRAMIAGNVACFITACIAGLLYQDEKQQEFSIG